MPGVRVARDERACVAPARCAALARCWRGASRRAAAATEQLPPADWREIRRSSSTSARRSWPATRERAFAHASPGIRALFGDAAAFLAMVRASYAALLEARDAASRSTARSIDGDVIQPLRLVMPDGTVLVALYTMETPARRRWRIAGCVIAPSTLRAT